METRADDVDGATRRGRRLAAWAAGLGLVNDACMGMLGSPFVLVAMFVRLLIPLPAAQRVEDAWYAWSCAGGWMTGAVIALAGIGLAGLSVSAWARRWIGRRLLRLEPAYLPPLRTGERLVMDERVLLAGDGLLVMTDMGNRTFRAAMEVATGIGAVSLVVFAAANWWYAPMAAAACGLLWVLAGAARHEFRSAVWRDGEWMREAVDGVAVWPERRRSAPLFVKSVRGPLEIVYGKASLRVVGRGEDGRRGEIQIAKPGHSPLCHWYRLRIARHMLGCCHDDPGFSRLVDRSLGTYRSRMARAVETAAGGESEYAHGASARAGRADERGRRGRRLMLAAERWGVIEDGLLVMFISPIVVLAAGAGLLVAGQAGATVWAGAATEAAGMGVMLSMGLLGVAIAGFVVTGGALARIGRGLLALAPIFVPTLRCGERCGGLGVLFASDGLLVTTDHGRRMPRVVLEVAIVAGAASVFLLPGPVGWWALVYVLRLVVMGGVLFALSFWATVESRTAIWRDGEALREEREVFAWRGAWRGERSSRCLHGPFEPTFGKATLRIEGRSASGDRAQMQIVKPRADAMGHWLRLRVAKLLLGTCHGEGCSRLADRTVKEVRGEDGEVKEKGHKA